MSVSCRRFLIHLLCCYLLLRGVHAANETTSSSTTNVSAVVLDNQAAFGVCVYPTSGPYSFLNRLIYYCTLIFSLFSRSHLWLVTGALAAALTYSGFAAVHACLLSWRGPCPYIENDIWPLMAILSTAGLIAVPLLNWSGTLRRLGAKFMKKKDAKALHTQSDFGTRTIAVYWAFLILVGYMSIWKQYYWNEGETNQEYPDMTKVMCRSGTNASMFLSSDGSSHRRAIDQNFISANGCNNPCDQINIPSLFRWNSDLVLLPYKEALVWNGTLTAAKYHSINEKIAVQNVFLDKKEYILFFVLLQGFIVVCFGRRDPREIRDFLYIKLYMERPFSQKPALAATQDYAARILAFLSYVIAVLVVIVCIPLFLAVVLEQEWGAFHEIPDAEPMTNVGQWQPWAVAGQALAASLIWAYHDRVVAGFASLWRRAYSACRKSDSPRVEFDLSDNKDCLAEGSDAESGLKEEDMAGGKPKRGWGKYLLHVLNSIYKTCATPLNQSNEGIIDEVKNFYRWCRDPPRVARRVIRHPIRVRDSQTVKDQAGPEKEATEHFTPGYQSSFFRGASVRKPHGDRYA